MSRPVALPPRADVLLTLPVRIADAAVSETPDWTEACRAAPRAELRIAFADAVVGLLTDNGVPLATAKDFASRVLNRSRGLPAEALPRVLATQLVMCAERSPEEGPAQACWVIDEASVLKTAAGRRRRRRDGMEVAL